MIRQIQNNTDILTTSQALIENDQTTGIRPVISSMPNQSGFLARENHQFWRAGDYDVQSTQKRTITGGMDHVRVHPKFLHSNVTSHKWAFGAIAELFIMQLMRSKMVQLMLKQTKFLTHEITAMLYFFRMMEGV